MPRVFSSTSKPYEQNWVNKNPEITVQFYLKLLHRYT